MYTIHCRLLPIIIAADGSIHPGTGGDTYTIHCRLLPTDHNLLQTGPCTQGQGGYVQDPLSVAANGSYIRCRAGPYKFQDRSEGIRTRSIAAVANGS
jgi:hypothetical protein